MTFQERFKGKLSYIRKDGVKGMINREEGSKAEKSITQWQTVCGRKGAPQEETLETYENEFLERSMPVREQHSATIKPSYSIERFNTPERLRHLGHRNEACSEREEPQERTAPIKQYTGNRSTFGRPSSRETSVQNPAGKDRSCLVRVGSNILDDRFRLNIDEMTDKHRNIIRMFDTNYRFC